MQSIKQPEELKLKEIFAGSEYVIPIYQRSYAWEKDEIEQLLNDIYDSTGRYYLGSLIVDEVFPNIFSVIDGQQRLTTLFLLLIFLNDGSLSRNALRFEAREKSNTTLKDLFEKRKIEKEKYYSGEIIDGFEIIKNYFAVAESKNNNYKDQFFIKLENIVIIRTHVPKQIDLNHYFEIMNTRGEQLEIHEIAKGKIIDAIAQKFPDFMTMAGMIWDKCSQMDSYIQMNFDKESRRNLFGKDWDSFCCNDIKEVIEKTSLKNEETEKKSSLLEIIKESGNLKPEPTNESAEENERFESIITFPNFLLIVNEALKNPSKEDDDTSLDDKKFLATLETHWQSSENALNFIFSLLKCRFLFDKYIIKREFAKDYKEEGKWSLQKLQMYYDQQKKQEKPSYKLTYSSDENESDKKTETLRSLQSALRITYTSPKTMHWISKVLAVLIQSQDADLQKLLEEYACKKIENANYKETRGFGIDRIVFTYLDYILNRDNPSLIPNYQFQFRTSIEHFYPQHPIEKARWDEESLDCFGNLALITVKSNSKFSNLDPLSKVTSYPDTIKQSPKLKLMCDRMKENNTWTEELAKEHEKNMLSLLEKEINNTCIQPTTNYE